MKLSAAMGLEHWLGKPVHCAVQEASLQSLHKSQDDEVQRE